MKKVTFKTSKEVNLKNIWPVITEDYFKLLEGLDITLSDQQLKNYLENKSFFIGSQEISGELIKPTVSDDKSTSKLDEFRIQMKDHYSKSFLFMDDMIDAITHGVELNRNVLLYGRGGHNKSEGTSEILKGLHSSNLISNSFYKKAFGDGLTTDDLFGGVKLKKAMETGEMEYNVENSFMNYEYVVFEEFFDAPPQVLLALKDILSSRKFNNGKQVFDIKTKCVIALTNRSKEEVLIDDSNAALNERFLITLKVEWPEDAYTFDNFKRLAIAKFGKEFYEKFKFKIDNLAKIAEASNLQQTSFISPRTFVQAVELYCNGGDLKFVSDLDQVMVKKVLSGAGPDTVSLKENEMLYNRIKKGCDENHLLYANDPANQLISGGINDTLVKAAKKNKIEAMLTLLEQSVWHSSIKGKVDVLISTLNGNKNQL